MQTSHHEMKTKKGGCFSKARFWIYAYLKGLPSKTKSCTAWIHL